MRKMRLTPHALSSPHAARVARAARALPTAVDLASVHGAELVLARRCTVMETKS